MKGGFDEHGGAPGLLAPPGRHRVAADYLTSEEMLAARDIIPILQQHARDALLAEGVAQAQMHYVINIEADAIDLDTLERSAIYAHVWRAVEIMSPGIN